MAVTGKQVLRTKEVSMQFEPAVADRHLESQNDRAMISERRARHACVPIYDSRLLGVDLGDD